MVLGRLDRTAIGHIHQCALPGLVNTQGFTFFVDMGNHHPGHLIGIGGKSPLAHTQFLKFFKQMLVEFGVFNNGEGNAKYRLNTGSDEVLSDTNGFFTHIFRCTTGRRQVGDAFPQTADLNHFGCGNQDAAVVHACAHA